MKKVIMFISVAMVSAFLAAPTVLAAKGRVDAKRTKDAENYVRQQFAEVLSEVSMEGTKGAVNVLFKVTDERSFEVLNVIGENLDLVKNVENVLKLNRIDVSAITEGKYVVKVNFVDRYATASYFTPATEVLRTEISDVLSSVPVTDGGSVVISFLVKNGGVIVKKVDSANSNLATEVEKILSVSSIEVPAELAGNYVLRVHF